MQNLFFKAVVLLCNRIPLCAIWYAVNMFDKVYLRVYFQTHVNIVMQSTHLIVKRFGFLSNLWY